MSLDFIEGFDNYANSVVNTDAVTGHPWTGATAANSRFLAGFGRTGNVAIGTNTTVTTGNPRNRAELLNPGVEKTLGVAHRYNLWNDTSSLYSPSGFGMGGGAGTAGLRFGFDFTNQIKLYNTSVPTLLYTSPVLTAGVWYYCELYWNCVTGDIEFRINEQTVFIGNSINPSVSIINHVHTGKMLSTTGTSGTSFFDDVYVIDGKNFLGDSRVGYMRPNSNLANQDFVPSSAPAWDRLNDVPGSTVSYIEGSAIGNISDFTVSPVPSPLFQVHGVKVQSKVLRSGAAVEEYQPRILVNGTGYNGSTLIAPSTTYAWDNLKIWSVNPATGLPWQVSDIPLLGVGIEKVS